MQDTNPPTVTMADENLPKQTWSTGEASRRAWTCPSDNAIASYVDGTLREKQRSRVELHLSKCSYCRQIVADTVKAQREVEPTAPPTTLFNKAVLAVPTRAVNRTWLLVPAGVVAIVVAIAAAAIFLRHPKQAVVPPPHSISAPVVAKSAAAPNAKSPVSDVVRNLPTNNPTLRITFPRAGSVVKNQPLQIKWVGTPGAGFYEVSVLASDGDLVWKGQTRELLLAMPPSVSLKDGSYFVSVTSYNPNGRTVKAAPISFVVKR